MIPSILKIIPCSLFALKVFLKSTKHVTFDKQVPDEQSDINNLSGSSAASNGIVNIRSTFDESLVQNGPTSEMANDSTAFVKTITNGHQGVGVPAVSSNVAVTSLEKSVLIEELIQTLRETYDRMPAHLLQYELAKAKALSVLKFT